jgi:hypothetical protein
VDLTNRHKKKLNITYYFIEDFVKKIFALFIFALMISACDKSSSSSSDTSFRIKSGSLTKFASPTGTVYNIDLGTHTGSYAIIFNHTINGTNYVGIACSNNPESETYNLKIYYAASSIISGTYSATIVENGGAPNTESLTLTIALNAGLSTTKYNVYDINGNSTNVGLIDISAVQVGTN